MFPKLALSENFRIIFFWKEDSRVRVKVIQRAFFVKWKEDYLYYNSEAMQGSGNWDMFQK